MSSISLDGLLLADYLGACQKAHERIAFIVTGGRGSGKSTVLKRFISGCSERGLLVRRPGDDDAGEGAFQILYGDYYNITESVLRSGGGAVGRPCLVLDDINLWGQLRCVNGVESFGAFESWHGHLVLSAPSMAAVPPSVLASFVAVEYPVVAPHQAYILRRIREAHPTASRGAALRLSQQTPRGLPTSVLMEHILAAVVSANTGGKNTNDRVLAFESSYLSGVRGASVVAEQRLPMLPPCLASLHERSCLLLNQHLAQFMDVDTSGAVSRMSSSTTGILLSGVTGSGKTLLTYALEEAFPSVPFLRAASFEFFGKYLGESEERLRDFFRSARHQSPCVVVLEDIDVLGQKRSEGTEGSSVAKRVLTALLCELDGVEDTTGVLVIGTTSAVDTIDGALLRQGRLETVLELPCLGVDDVRALLSEHSRLIAATHVTEECLSSRVVGKSLAQFAQVMRALLEATL